MKRLLMAFLVLGALAVVPGVAGAEEQAATHPSHGVLHKVVMYIPNRVLDVLDIVRLRVRVGPGIAAGARATEVASAFVGAYDTVYVGLPGPRNRPEVKSPIGFESRTGVQASVLDATTSVGPGPDYSTTEIGAGVQAAIIGVDVGIDPVEIADLLAGFFFLDLRNDDL
jgi:hypothetical protein